MRDQGELIRLEKPIPVADERSICRMKRNIDSGGVTHDCNVFSAF